MSLGKRSFTVAADSSSTLTERKLQQRGLKILEVLDHYYPDPPIPLDHRNDFTFLVAVVLSAQTTDGKVNEVTKELFDLADSPEKMSKLEVATIQRIIQPVGLAPKKAVYVQGLSRKIVEDFEGKVPNTYEGLESLPGVGHKTASVIMSQLFGQNSFAVDTHVHRLALRWGLSKEERNVDKVQADLCRIFPEQSWNKAHLQMIYFGREYCSAKNHTPSECPICSWVRSDKERDTSSEALARFSPQKRAKGLVYYEDRARELQRDPSLAVFSSPRAENRVTSITANEAKEQSPSGKLDFSDSVEEEVVAKEEGKTLKKKIKKEEMKEEMFRRSSRSLRRTSTK